MMSHLENPYHRILAIDRGASIAIGTNASSIKTGKVGDPSPDLPLFYKKKRKSSTLFAK